MELAALQESAEAVIDVPLLHDVNGKATDGVKVVGVNSQKYQEAERAWRVTNLLKTAERGGAIDSTQKAGAEEIVANVNAHRLLIAKACVVEIYGFTINGEKMPLDEKHLDALFAARPSWVARVLNSIEAEDVFTEA